MMPGTRVNIRFAEPGVLEPSQERLLARMYDMAEEWKHTHDARPSRWHVSPDVEAAVRASIEALAIRAMHELGDQHVQKATISGTLLFLELPVEPDTWLPPNSVILDP